MINKTNKEYVDLVNSGNFPSDIEVPLDPPFIDGRGTIQNLWLGNSGSVTLIKSNKGAIRASHIHKNGDFHAIYIISGKLRYIEKENDNILIDKTFKENDMFFTKPEVFHTVEFLENSVMLTINNIVKNHENYESSIVRSMNLLLIEYDE